MKKIDLQNLKFNNEKMSEEKLKEINGGCEVKMLYSDTCAGRCYYPEILVVCYNKCIWEKWENRGENVMKAMLKMAKRLQVNWGTKFYAEPAEGGGCHSYHWH